MAKKGLTYEQLEAAFRHRNFKPLYFLFGEERFLVEELERLLIACALAPHERDFNFDLLYGAESEASEVLSLCRSFPMMAERRLVIVRDFDKLKENRLFTDYAEHPNPQAVVLLSCATKPNLSAHPYRALKAHAAWGEFKKFYDNQMPGWVAGRVRGQGYEIEPEAVQMLADYVGTNLQAAAAEIEKIITYTGARQRITGEDVIQASGQTRDFNVFELQRAIGEGRSADALRIADRMLQQASNARGEALLIVSVLTTYFTKLWKLTTCADRHLPDKAIAARIGVSPYFVKEYLFSRKRFSLPGIERAFAALLAADFELKGGAGRDERLVLTLLLRRLVPPTPARAHPA